MHRASVDKRDFTTAHHPVMRLVNPPNVTLQFKVKLCCSTFRPNFKAYHVVWFAKSWNKSETRLIPEAVQMRAHLAAMLYVGLAAKKKEASTHPIYSPLGPLMPKTFPPQGEAVWEQLAISLSPSSTSPWLIHLGGSWLGGDVESRSWMSCWWQVISLDDTSNTLAWYVVNCLKYH